MIFFITVSEPKEPKSAASSGGNELSSKIHILIVS